MSLKGYVTAISTSRTVIPIQPRAMCVIQQILIDESGTEFVENMIHIGSLATQQLLTLYVVHVTSRGTPEPRLTDWAIVNIIRPSRPMPLLGGVFAMCGHDGACEAFLTRGSISNKPSAVSQPGNLS